MSDSPSPPVMGSMSEQEKRDIFVRGADFVLSNSATARKVISSERVVEMANELFPDLPAAPEQDRREEEPKDHLVWSYEHRAWWGAEGRGYTGELLWAGLYTKAEAEDIANRANRCCGRKKKEMAISVIEALSDKARECWLSKSNVSAFLASHIPSLSER